MNNTTDMRESKMASSTTSNNKVQVTSWLGCEHIGSESLSDMEILHCREGTNHDLLEGVDVGMSELVAGAESNVIQAELQGRGVRGHLVPVPHGGRSQGRGEGHQVGHHCEEIRLYNFGRTGSLHKQLQITNHSSVSLQAVSTKVTGQVSESYTQISKHSLFSMTDLLKIFESGPRIQAHYINDVAKALMEQVQEEKEEASFQFFSRSVHCRFVSIGKQAFLGLVVRIHEKRVPVLFCRAVHSAATK